MNRHYEDKENPPELHCLLHSSRDSQARHSRQPLHDFPDAHHSREFQDLCDLDRRGERPVEQDELKREARDEIDREPTRKDLQTPCGGSKHTNDKTHKNLSHVALRDSPRVTDDLAGQRIGEREREVQEHIRHKHAKDQRIARRSENRVNLEPGERRGEA